MDMIDKFDLNQFPSALNRNAVLLNFSKLEEKRADISKLIKSSQSLNLLTESIFSNSPYLSEIILKNPDFYISLFKLGFDKSFEDIILNLQNQKFELHEDIMRFLRLEKLKTSLLIAIAEITKLWSIEKTTEKLSIFADLAILKACEFLLIDANSKKIIKLKDELTPFKNCGLIIIALGKLGSYELNYSSDIDLSVFYEDNKLEYLGRKTLPQFYIELAQSLTTILSERTKDGYVFRVDMRLRPDPGSNPIAISLKKAEKYYFTVGQNWERAAMIKYRIVCGDKKSGDIFSEFMEKNVWRKSLDFETIEDIHSIKRQIDTKQGLHTNNFYGFNVKLGKGGIREIEFYAQTQQLIWGGRKPDLRRRKTSNALLALAKEGEIEAETANNLIECYRFYRMVEHRLQMVNDDQTHTLPKNEDEMEQIAIFCGFDSSKNFLDALHQRILTVRNYYSKLFETSPSLASNLPEATGSLIFTGIENHPDTLDTLGKMGFKNPDKVSDFVRGWHHGRYKCLVTKKARAQLTKLMPLLFTAFAKSPNPDSAFIHFDEFLSKQPETSQILSMLYLNNNLLDLLAEVFGGYPEIADNLSKNPSLIEYVLASEFYKKLPDIAELEKSLNKEIAASKKDFNTNIETIKNWVNDRKFRIGIQLVKNEISVELVFKALSNIAETALKAVLKICQKSLEKELGIVKQSKFAAIAFGKFGSKELTFNSDLDLVFIYDTKTEKQLFEASSYFIQLTSKIVSAMSSITLAGKLYEIDLRLRPLGESGSIATNLKSFEQYYNPDKQQGNAWVFEYIALTRARVISLDDKFSAKIQKIIKQKLQHKWNKELLHKEANFIHEKFRKNKKPDNNNIFDIKNAEGGLFDLEFMIRFLQLKYLYLHPKIYGQSSIRTINNLYKAKIIEKEDYEIILKAYEFYKKVQNILRITSENEILNYTQNILCKRLNFKNIESLKAEILRSKETIKNLNTKYLQN
jgi:glutamate-ammonia-ligase adenylyltransferase